MNNDHDRLSNADAPMRVRNAHPRAENAPVRAQNAPLRVPSLFPTRTCACVLGILALLSAATFSLASPV